MSATSPETGRLPGPTGAAAGPPPRRLGLALAVIATAQLMVVLDTTIVNDALPHIQDALHFSGSSLEWVVNGYTLAFGGLLLLGGRSGDLLGRRRIFIFGIVLFSVASLLGGLATSQAWLLAARAVQGVGAAFAAPTALSLIAVTFPEGAPRNRAMARVRVDERRRGLGRADRQRPACQLRQLAVGAVRQRADRRARRAARAPRAQRVGAAAGNFDLPGAVTASLGLAALVYGLSNAATTSNGVSHWGDTKVIASLVAAAVLLGAFAVIEARASHPLLPVRVLRSRDRSGAYLIALCVGTALFGMFFFLTLFLQDVWGYSALKSGVAYLPIMATVMVMSGAASQLVPRVGARPLLIAGSVIAAGGLFWLSRLTEHSSYAGGVLGPMMVTAAGIGLMFVPMSLVALTKVGGRRRRRRVIAAEHRPAGRRVDRARGARHGGVERGRLQPAVRCGARPRARLRVLPRLRRVGGDHPAHPGRRARHAPGEARGPGRHQPDGGAVRLSAVPSG